MSKPWSKEDTELLKELWGKRTITQISKELGRSINAIRLYRQRSGMASAKDSMEGEISIHSLAKAFGIDYKTILRCWIDNHGLTYRERNIGIKNMCKMVDIDKFWKWAYKNRDCIDFSKMHDNLIGWTPDWVKKEKSRDHNDLKGKGNAIKWSLGDEERLIGLLRTCRYTHRDLAKQFPLRTEGSIKRKILNLKETGRLPGYLGPLPCKPKPWTGEEEALILKWREDRVPLNIMAERLDRSTIQVQGKFERLDNPERGKRSYRNAHAKNSIIK